MKYIVFALFLFGISLSSKGQSKIDFNQFNFKPGNLNLLVTDDSNFCDNPLPLVLLEQKSSADESIVQNAFPFALENYILNINHQNYSANGVLRLNFKNIGKFTLDNYYGEFNNDLSKYIQRAPDIMELCPIY